MRAKREPVRGIRWSPDTGWELRCPVCANAGKQAYWPLTDEFWKSKSVTRCRACWNERYARQLREKYRASPEYRAEMNRRNRLRKQEARDVERLKERTRREAWSDEWRQHVRDRQRLAQRRYRARRKEAA